MISNTHKVHINGHHPPKIYSAPVFYTSTPRTVRLSHGLMLLHRPPNRWALDSTTRHRLSFLFFQNCCQKDCLDHVWNTCETSVKPLWNPCETLCNDPCGQMFWARPHMIYTLLALARGATGFYMALVRTIVFHASRPDLSTKDGTFLNRIAPSCSHKYNRHRVVPCGANPANNYLKVTWWSSGPESFSLRISRSMLLCLG